MIKTKYPKTFHFPWSENLQNDDRMLPSIKCFEDKDIVITYKLDGECTSWYRNDFHARSLDSLNHPSRNYVKSLWGSLRHLIPEDIRICGENVYAEHSIRYENLPTFFFVFGIYQTIENEDVCLSVEETQKLCDDLGLQHIPILYKGPWNIEQVKKCYIGKDPFGNDQEGYVVRNSQRFLYNDFENNVAKFVRKNHIQTDEHWLKTWKPNKLKE